MESRREDTKKLDQTRFDETSGAVVLDRKAIRMSKMGGPNMADILWGRPGRRSEQDATAKV